jgi:uncharacterized protein (TIGR02231 family)
MNIQPSRSLATLAAFAAFVAALPLVSPASLSAAPEALRPVAAEAANPITAESKIAAATVYPDRAVVSRVATAKVGAGANEVVFAGLPSGLMDDSVQVTAKGSVAASLLDIATRTVFVTAEPDARVKALEDKLVELRREERALNDQNALLESQRGLLGTIEKAYTTPTPAAAGATPPARPALEDYAKLLSFSAEQRTRLDEQARKLERDRAALGEKIAASEAQLNEVRGKQPGRRATKVVTVRLAAPAAGELEVRLSYAISGASWTPAYDARLRSAERKVQLDAFGLVRNATGEDWKNVDLTLSTARPGLGGSAPEVSPWYVDVSRPVVYGKAASGSMALDRAAGMTSAAAKGAFSNDARMISAAAEQHVFNLSADAPASPPAAEATFAAAELASAATSASFRIATPVTLASDNAPQRVPVGAASFEAGLQYQATPKLQETAYLAAYVLNTSELPFLGGAMNVFLDDTFVASSRLATTMPGEKFTLNLGADEGISIKRKIVSRFTEDTGFTTRSRRTTYEILVTVTNNKRTSERVVVKDAAPVARDEKILVKLLAPMERELLKPEDAAVQPPRPGIARAADGKITWRFDLKPGEKRELPLKFSIEHPADLPVTGVD